MKKLLSILFIVSYSLAFSQFDKIVADPLLVHPSFAGNTGKKRISSFYAFEKRRNTQVVSYDFFSQKLKGAWGLRVANHRFYFNNEANLKIVYSPKFTSRLKKKTWAPAIGIDYSSFYKDRYDEIYGLSIVIWEKFHSNKALNFSLSVSRNSDKSLLSMTVNYEPILNTFSSDLMYVYKFDKNTSNKLSSTFSISDRIIINDPKTPFGEGFYFNIETDPLFRSEFLGTFRNTQNRFLASYSLKYRKVVLQFDTDLAAYKKYKTDEVFVPHDVYPIEKYGQYFINTYSTTLGLNFDKLSVYGTATLGNWFAEETNSIAGKPSATTSKEDGIFQGIDTYSYSNVHYNYKKLSFGMNYTF